MRKQLKNIISALITIVLIYLILHSTPKIALRTHLFVKGHPIISFTTGIVEDELRKNLSKQSGNKVDEYYMLTRPPFEKATESVLSNYEVTKKGFLYFAKYYGEA
jgi:hypothetical protein